MGMGSFVHPSLRFRSKKLFVLILVQLMVFGLFLLALAPATTLDSFLRRTTDSRFALLMAEGSFWNGQAQLATLDALSGRYRPVLPLSWQWNPSALLRGRMSWQLSFATGNSAALDIMPGGIQIGAVTIDVSARPLLEQIPNTVGRLGWHGDFRIASPGWGCSWGGVCQGSAAVNWWGASLDIFPDHSLGNYIFNIKAESDHLALGLTTASGELQITGTGTWKKGAVPGLSGTITGDTYFLSRLPNVAGQWIKRGASSESLVFSL